MTRILDSVRAYFAWARERVCEDAPGILSSAFLRPVARWSSLRADGCLLDRGVVRRSLLGREIRSETPIAGQGELGLQVELGSEQVFTQSVSVNAQIARRGDSALRARLARHSPIPEGDAVIAYELVGADGRDRVSVDLVVARRSDIERVRDLVAVDNSDWRVVAISQTGRQVELSASLDRTTREIFAPGARLAGLIVATLLLGLSWVDRLHRQEAELIDQRARLLAEARVLRGEEAESEQMQRLRPFQDSYTTLSDLLSAMTLISDQPEIEQGVWRIEYRLPDTLHVTPSDETRAAVMIPLYERPDTEAAE